MRDLGFARVATEFSPAGSGGKRERWELACEVGLIEYGSPSLRNLSRARRYGVRILREDTLRAVRPSRRLRDGVADGPWIAMLEAMAFATAGAHEAAEYIHGGGI